MPRRLAPLLATALCAVRVLGDGASTHAVVSAAQWQAARPRGRYALVTWIVAPGFELADFELAHRDELARAFPTLSEAILSQSLL